MHRQNAELDWCDPFGVFAELGHLTKAPIVSGRLATSVRSVAILYIYACIIGQPEKVMTMHIVSLKNIYGLAHVIHHAGLPINEYMLRGIVKHQPLFGVFYSFQG